MPFVSTHSVDYPPSLSWLQGLSLFVLSATQAIFLRSPCHLPCLISLWKSEVENSLSLSAVISPLDPTEHRSNRTKRPRPWSSVRARAGFEGAPGQLRQQDDVWTGLGLYPRAIRASANLMWRLGLASLPGTATIESEFSIVKWEKDAYRTGLTDFSLEGILQAKHFSKFNSITF